MTQVAVVDKVVDGDFFEVTACEDLVVVEFVERGVKGAREGGGVVPGHEGVGV